MGHVGGRLREERSRAIVLRAKEDQVGEGKWGVWKFPRRTGARTLFVGTRDESVSWAKEHHAEHVQLHVMALDDVDLLRERIRELCASAGTCGEGGCTSVATCELLRVLDESAG
jgi:hypothetical protein